MRSGEPRTMRTRAAEELSTLLMNDGKDFGYEFGSFEKSLAIFMKNLWLLLYWHLGLTQTFTTDFRSLETEVSKGGATKWTF